MQEALTNVAKHSEAEFVEVKLQSVNKTLQLRVDDNGKGFDVESSRRKLNALGRLGMAEGMELSGGIFTIESEIGKGHSFEHLGRFDSRIAYIHSVDTSRSLD